MTTAGLGELHYDSSLFRAVLVALQVALWFAAFVVVTRLHVATNRRRALVDVDEPLIDLTSEPIVGLDHPATDIDTTDGASR